ncbi:hypothetical protein [Epilithonimonas sp.]|uniref:hypothetical protein n=1 Tax=Epilithonimonas sp. TaxID=2894511 RepID=UPI002FDD4515
MKNIVYYIFGFFILSSCSPNQDENGDFLHGVEYDTEVGVSNSTIKNIKKITTIDDAGDKVITTYNYSDNKLTGVTSDNNSFNYTLTYNGDDITKIVYKNEDTASGDAMINTQNLTYTGGKLVRSEGTTATSDGTIIYVSSTNYNYASDKIKSIVTKIKDETNTTEMFTLQTDYTFVGNNLTNFKYSLTTAPGPVTSSPIVLTTALSSFDTNKNPLGTLPLAFKLVSSHFDLENNVVSGFSVNNYKTLKLTSNVETITANFKYVYDKDGYPTLGTSEMGTVEFEYVK